MKLNAQVYTDSKLANKLQCGRTKAEAVVCNVLCPHSIEVVVKDIKFPESKWFSISTDASNKGNLKFFPVVVQYFLTKEIKNAIIDLHQRNNETAESISAMLLETLTTNGLEMSQISAYGADNANVNYGKNNSVFTKLRDLNVNIVPAGCNCHIIHNAAKFACKALPVDIENVVIKVFNEFASSAKALDKLKKCFEFAEIEFSECLRHVPTRWLSLFTALDRLLLNWPAIKVYFLNEGEGECPKVIWEIIKDQQHGLFEGNHLSIAECFLFFAHNFLTIFQQFIKRFESSTTLSTDVYNWMSELRQKLQTRQGDQFFGFKVNQ